MVTRRRMTKSDRRDQLVEVARRIVVEEGADALTLGHLAVAAGVSKPVVYDHFGSRAGVLVALYEDYDRRQTALLVEALDATPTSLDAQVATVARCHVACVLDHGAEIGGVVAALSGTPAMAEVKRGSDAAYVEICRRAFDRSAAPAAWTDAAAVAFLGAADAVSEAALDQTITRADAESALVDLLASQLAPRPGARQQH
ncbi:TetR/AcrR family transcriptional regulator [Nocardioides hwasunensis]|uniref:TetR/AcrR family transcriptional regulator n=2 Tax=Nocardioides hwasunensis TaxID=397258 RepID=A0ABR8MM85_9ACTN|nr:TetR/AcrR family transcriptional regulator [Nocardioides hwasunensis]